MNHASILGHDQHAKVIEAIRVPFSGSPSKNWSCHEQSSKHNAFGDPKNKTMSTSKTKV